MDSDRSGAEFSPLRPSQLFVSNAHNGAGLGTVSAFRVSRVGFISAIGTSPFADLQTAPCWVEISHNGKYLYAVNTGSGSISSYSIDRHGQLTLIGSFPFTNGTGAIDARLSPDGRTLSVLGGPLRCGQLLRRQRWEPDRIQHLAHTASRRHHPSGVVVT